MTSIFLSFFQENLKIYGDKARFENIMMISGIFLKKYGKMKFSNHFIIVDLK